MRRARVAWDECDVRDEPAGDGGRREEAVIADVARCPVCRAPVQARLGRRGPYMHCLCAGATAPEKWSEIA
jgi:hypothetical protein